MSDDEAYPDMLDLLGERLRARGYRAERTDDGTRRLSARSPSASGSVWVGAYRGHWTFFWVPDPEPDPEPFPEPFTDAFAWSYAEDPATEPDPGEPIGPVTRLRTAVAVIAERLGPPDRP